MLGKQFGSLVVVGVAGPKQGFLICVCSCGTTVTYPRSKVVRGFYKSCGCLKKKQQDRIAARLFRHGCAVSGKHTRTYRIWQGMLNRCRNPNQKMWHRYGGRGIKVCAEWLVFENFVRDMGEAPEGLTLDRKDNDGNYELGNCRWTTRTHQRRNNSTVRQLVVGGQALYSWEWATKLNISMKTVRARYKKLLKGVITEERFLWVR